MELGGGGLRLKRSGGYLYAWSRKNCCLVVINTFYNTIVVVKFERAVLSHTI